MGKRGPKSAAEMLMIENNTASIQRPDAPYNLSDAAAEQWRFIVAAMPADHFAPSHYAMLTQLCRHNVESDRIHQLIEQCCAKKGKSFDLATYDKLTVMQGRESTHINRLMRSMRLTHQSLLRQDSVKHRPVVTGLLKAPWDGGSDGDDEE